MKAVWRDTLLRAVIGASLGMLIGILLCKWNDLTLLKSVLPDAAYGAIVMGSTVLYDIEPWSLTRATIYHLVITLVCSCFLGMIQNWLSHTPLWMLLVFLVAYFAIWMFQWAICYRRVYKMNETLRQRQRKKRTEQND